MSSKMLLLEAQSVKIMITRQKNFEIKPKIKLLESGRL